MKRIMITGIGGFVGSRLYEHYRIKYTVKGFTHFQLDFADEEQVYYEFELFQPDIVIHCGAVSDVRQCEKEPKQSYLTNVTGSENIAKACKKHNARMIFFSSDQVYFGNDGLQPHTEEEKLSPANVYGQQKLEAEQKCMEANPDTVCLRLSWMYDNFSKSDTEHGDLVKNVLNAVKKRQTMTYPIYDFRGITYVKEVVENMEKVFEIPAGIYNFGSENNVPTYDIVKHMLHLLAAEDKLLLPNADAFADKPRNLCMDSSKIKACGIEFTETKIGIENCIQNRTQNLTHRIND